MHCLHTVIYDDEEVRIFPILVLKLADLLLLLCFTFVLGSLFNGSESVLVLKTAIKHLKAATFLHNQ